MTEPPRRDPAPRQTQSLWDTIKSVNASFFGVQSARNRARDEAHGKASHFIIVGLIMTGVFVGVVYLAVRLVLRQAGM